MANIDFSRVNELFKEFNDLKEITNKNKIIFIIKVCDTIEWQSTSIEDKQQSAALNEIYKEEIVPKLNEMNAIAINSIDEIVINAIKKNCNKYMDEDIDPGEFLFMVNLLSSKNSRIGIIFMVIRNIIKK